MVQNIQLLRAFAAYLVVLHHVQLDINNFNYSLKTNFGASGVEIFFIVSGFIMVFTASKQQRSLSKFWKDRIIRIIPLYWLATFCMVALSLAGLSPWGLHGWDVTNLFTSLAFLPTMRPDGIAAPILTPGWTLNYEMFFYFLFGLGLLLRDQLRAVLAITGIFIGLWIWGLVFTPSSYIVFHYVSPLPLEFAIGCFLGLLYTRSDIFFVTRPYRVAIPLFIIGVTVIILSDILFYGLTESAQMRMLVFGIPALLIVTAALILERSGCSYSGRFLLLQGAASYSIYLFHPLLLQSTFKAAGKILPVSAPVVTLLVTLLAVTVVCLGGTLIHLWIEKPLSRILRGDGGRRRDEAYVVGLADVSACPRATSDRLAH